MHTKEQTSFLSFTDDLKQVNCDLLLDDYSLGMYSTDASFYQIRPIAVVLPRDEEDVRKTVEIARRHKKKILPRGGGTGHHHDPGGDRHLAGAGDGGGWLGNHGRLIGPGAGCGPGRGRRTGRCTGRGHRSGPDDFAPDAGHRLRAPPVPRRGRLPAGQHRSPSPRVPDQGTGRRGRLRGMASRVGSGNFPFAKIVSQTTFPSMPVTIAAVGGFDFFAAEYQ